MKYPKDVWILDEECAKNPTWIYCLGSDDYTVVFTFEDLGEMRFELWVSHNTTERSYSYIHSFLYGYSLEHMKKYGAFKEFEVYVENRINELHTLRDVYRLHIIHSGEIKETY